MVMIDCISRLVPGVLGNGDSAEIESFYDNLLEYPQYTRPEVYEGKTVPEVLLSGHHKNIESWRREQSIRRTLERRPDLLEDASLTLKEQKFLDSLLKEQGESQLKELEQLVREAVKSDETPGSDREYYQQMKKVKKLLNEKKATLQELKGYYKVLGALKQEIEVILRFKEIVRNGPIRQYDCPAYHYYCYFTGVICVFFLCGNSTYHGK